MSTPTSETRGIGGVGKEWPFRLTSSPPRRPLAGRALKVLGLCIVWIPLGFMPIAFLAMAVFASIVAFFDIETKVLSQPDQDLALAIVFVIGAFLMALLLASPLAPFLLERGRRLSAPDALAVLSADPRPPVLYLRSFDDDNVANPTPPLLFAFGRERYEISLVRVLRRIGPTISISRPDEAMPELGAARLHVHPEDWQEAVRYFMGTAAVVLVVVGRSQGLWWEICEAIGRVAPNRLLFFFPYVESKEARVSRWRQLYLWFRGTGTTHRQLRVMEQERQERYTLFRARTKELFDAAIPEKLGQSQFLFFTAAGEPLLLETQRPLLSRLRRFPFDRTTRTHINLNKTLKPLVSNWITKTNSAMPSSGRSFE